MLDTLPLFTELPQYLYLDYDNKELKRHKVPMGDIVSFEIVFQPSEKWLMEIERKCKTCFSKVNGPGSTGDFLEPSWVHELVANQDELKRLKDNFKEWHRK